MRIPLTLACVFLFSVAGTGRELLPKEPSRADKKITDTVRRKANYFALVASKVIRRETTRGTTGAPGGFGQGGAGGRRWNDAQTYAGFLTPPYKGRLYVVGAATLPPDEEFKHVRIHFQGKPGKGYGATYVGQDKASTVLVFLLDKRVRFPKSFRRPHLPRETVPVMIGERVVSLGHPYLPEKKTWVNWRTCLGVLRDPPRAPAPKHWPLHKLGPMLRHESRFGRYAHYWHGGPLVRVDENRNVEILGMNTNSMQGVHRAIPYHRLLGIRNAVIEQASSK